MELLTEAEVQDYCGNCQSLNHNEELGELASRPQQKPLYYLPIFELCHAVYFGAQAGRLTPGGFRLCWNEFVVACRAHSYEGNLIRIHEEEDEDLAKALLGFKAPISINAKDRPADRRDHDNTYPAHCQRMRELYDDLREKLCIELDGEDEASRCWLGLSPEELLAPYKPTPANGGGDLVLDTNNAVEVLQSLTLDEAVLQLPSSFHPLVTRRISDSIRSGGRSGRLILPVTALEETERVVRKHPEQYANVRAQLLERARHGKRGPWQAIDLEGLSMVRFEVLLTLIEDLKHLTPASWPTFTDSMILAHGLYHGCPVASQEWLVEKQAWQAVASQYPWLVPT